MDLYAFCSRTIEETAEYWNTATGGLSSYEAAERLNKYGSNRIAKKEKKWWEVLYSQFKSPLVYLLIVAAGLDIVLREAKDGLIIGAIVLINASLGFVWEFRSEQTLKLLGRYLAFKNRVRRDGRIFLVDISEIVPGDIVELGPGNRIPADMRIIENDGLLVDESVLSGESAAVEKETKAITLTQPSIFALRNIGFAGTTVTHGRGAGIVLFTGDKTVWGEIARETVAINKESGFEKDLNRFSRMILKIILLTLVGIFGANILLKSGGVNISELLIFSIALAVSVIPEALPVVITFSLSRGALRLAHRKVIVKRLSAIEDLGSIEVLCTDKTGTLTENKLKIADVWGLEKEVVYEGVKVALPLIKSNLPVDAFDTALWEKTGMLQRGELKRGYKIIDETPFDPELRTANVILRGPDGKENIYRGATESILKLCHKIDRREKAEIATWEEEQGKLGRRVIAVAKNSKLVGLVAFTDQIKRTTKPAVHEAVRMGLRIVMLTGDSQGVASAVAREIGLIGDQSPVISGEAFDKMGVQEQHTAVEKYSVFARVTPKQKNKIIDLLQEKYRVGFLGEGINDGPALRSSDVGLVVQHAADVSREAADIILLKKDLGVIMAGIKEGRIVSSNTKKYILATLSSNMGNFYAVAVASLLVDFLPMLPLQILLLNLLSDFPMIAIATDNVDKKELERPQMLGLRQIVTVAAVLGVVSTIFDFVFFGVFYRSGPAILQTGWFLGSVLTELVFVFSIRARGWIWKAEPPSKLLLGLTLVAAMITIYLPLSTFGQRVFKFYPIGMNSLGIILFVVAVYLIATESVKKVFYRFGLSQ